MVAALIIVASFDTASPCNAPFLRWLSRKNRTQKGCLSASVRTDDCNLVPSLNIKFGIGKQHSLLFSTSYRNGKIINYQNVLDWFRFKSKADLRRLQAAAELSNRLQPLQHLLPGLRHFCCRGTHQIACHIILQLGTLFLLLFIQLFLAGVLFLPLFGVGGIISLVFPQSRVLQLPYFIAKFIKEVAVV